MNNLHRWRSNTEKLLSAPVRRQRSIKSVIGKVEDRFEPILAARQRGMSWKAIALALEDEGPISVDAVESAFKRVCLERGVSPPRRPALKTGNPVSPVEQPPAAVKPQPNLFGEETGRWVDDGE